MIKIGQLTSSLWLLKLCRTQTRSMMQIIPSVFNHWLHRLWYLYGLKAGTNGRKKIRVCKEAIFVKIQGSMKIPPKMRLWVIFKNFIIIEFSIDNYRFNVEIFIDLSVLQLLLCSKIYHHLILYFFSFLTHA